MTDIQQQPIKVFQYNSLMHKTKMAEDPEYRSHVNNMARIAMVRRYQTDNVYRERQKQLKNERYKNDPEYRAKNIERSRINNALIKERKAKAESV